MSSTSIIPRPTWLQSAFCTALLVSLSAATAPYTFAVVVLTLIHNYLLGGSTSDDFSQKKSAKRTVLLTGARGTKCLELARAFSMAGHRVIVAEESAWFALNPTQFSRAIAKFRVLPDRVSFPDRYAKMIQRICTEEKVDLFLPCSSSESTLQDAEVAATLGGKTKSFVQPPKQIARLNEKDAFMNLCAELSMLMPRSRLVTSLDDAISFIHNDTGTSEHLRYIAIPRGRHATNPPINFRSSTPSATKAHFERNNITISPENPYQLQEYVHGKKYSTFSIVLEGELKAFVCYEGSGLTCKVAENEDAVKQAEHWTTSFLTRWEDRLALLAKDRDEVGPKLTGHFCFDFIYDEDKQVFHPIKCRPRVNHAVALFNAENPADLAKCYLGQYPEGKTLYLGTSMLATESWIAEDLALSLAHYVPTFLHPSLPSIHAKPGQNPLMVLFDFLIGRKEDPTWSKSDPIPFFMFVHIQLPLQLIGRVFWSGVGLGSMAKFWDMRA